MYHTIAVVVLAASHLNEHLKNVFRLQKLHILEFFLICIIKKGKTKLYLKKTRYCQCPCPDMFQFLYLPESYKKTYFPNDQSIINRHTSFQILILTNLKISITLKTYTNLNTVQFNVILTLSKWVAKHFLIFLSFLHACLFNSTYVCTYVTFICVCVCVYIYIYTTRVYYYCYQFIFRWLRNNFYNHVDYVLFIISL